MQPTPQTAPLMHAYGDIKKRLPQIAKYSSLINSNLAVDHDDQNAWHGDYRPSLFL